MVQFAPPGATSVASNPSFQYGLSGCPVEVVVHDACDWSPHHACIVNSSMASNGSNLARFKHAIQTSVSASGGRVVQFPLQAFDENSQTVWSLPLVPANITVDLGTSAYIQEVAVTWRQSTGRQWSLAVAATEDDSAFSQVLTAGFPPENVTRAVLGGTTGTLDPKNFPQDCARPAFAPLQARYLRFQFLAVASVGAALPAGSISEVQVFGCDPGTAFGSVVVSRNTLPHSRSFPFVQPTVACNITYDNGTSSVEVPANLTTCNSSSLLTVNVDKVHVFPAVSVAVESTPVLTRVSPTVGSSQGGELIALVGSGFMSSSYGLEDAVVTIGGTVCAVDVAASDSTRLYCRTPPHASTVVDLPVALVFKQFPAVVGAAGIWFSFVDRWSSRATWGGFGLPQANEPVVVPAGQSLLLDVSPPPLLSLSILGKLVFEDSRDITVQVGRLVVEEGGVLQVGTASNPFQHRAIITLSPRDAPAHGSPPSLFNVSKGTVDLHGVDVVAWVPLAVTAVWGAQELALASPVRWEPGAALVLSGTTPSSGAGDEVAFVASISSDGLRVTLAAPLQFEHLGGSRTFGGLSLSAATVAAHAGLLSRTVVVQGSSDLFAYENQLQYIRWGDAASSNTVSVAAARSSRYRSASVLVTPGEPDDVVLRISNVEFRYLGDPDNALRPAVRICGPTGSVARPASGALRGSYLRGVSVHSAVGRGVSLSNLREFVVTGSVLYHTVGAMYDVMFALYAPAAPSPKSPLACASALCFGRVSLESGTEEWNIIEGNLGVFTVATARLEPSDLTPAVFHVRNPNNVVR